VGVSTRLCRPEAAGGSKSEVLPVRPANPVG
jgi:hypothetical protein